MQKLQLLKFGRNYQPLYKILLNPIVKKQLLIEKKDLSIKLVKMTLCSLL